MISFQKENDNINCFVLQNGSHKHYGKIKGQNSVSIVRRRWDCSSGFHEKTQSNKWVTWSFRITAQCITQCSLGKNWCRPGTRLDKGVSNWFNSQFCGSERKLEQCDSFKELQRKRWCKENLWHCHSQHGHW